MRTSLTRLVAGTAIAATALLGVAAGTANASTTPRQSTTLSIVAAHSSITVGQWDTIGGQLESHGKPVVHRIVTIESWNAKAKKWHASVERYTGSAGKVAYKVRPLSATDYRLVFLGGPNYKASHSGVVRIVVKPLPKAPTTLVITPSVSITAGTTTAVGGTLTVTKDAKALVGQWVWLDTVVSGKLHPGHAFKTGKLGTVAFKVKPAATTTYELVYLGTKVLAPTVSATATVTVTAAP